MRVIFLPGILILAECAIVLWPSLRYPHRWEIHTIALSVLAPILWGLGLRWKRSSLALVAVPLAWFAAIGPTVLAALGAFDACLATVCLVTYLGVTADALGRSARVPGITVEWTPTAARPKPDSPWIVMPVLVGIIAACMWPIAFPESLVPPDHRWGLYTPRVQTVAILIVGLYGLFLVDRLGRPTIAFRRTGRGTWLSLALVTGSLGIVLEAI